MAEVVVNDVKGKANPADKELAPTAQVRKRIPMSIPRQRLALPDIPGYHVHWFIGSPDRIQAALDGGYEWVTPEEAKYVLGTSLGSSALESGSSDLGTRVSVVAGGDVGLDGQAQRLYAMKLKQEWFDEDRKVLEQRNDQLANALAGAVIRGQTTDQAPNMGLAPGETAGDAANRYVPPNVKRPELFTKGAMLRRLGVR